MSLASDPSVSYSSAGNILPNNTTLNASANSNGNIVDFSTNSLGGFISVMCKGGATVNSTNGCQVGIFPASDGNSNYDTVSIPAFMITPTVNATSRESALVPTGRYNVQLTNLDPSNAITVGITGNPIA